MSHCGFIKCMTAADKTLVPLVPLLPVLLLLLRAK
jgi:hypothetical protein